jgi:hypothetical protein
MTKNIKHLRSEIAHLEARYDNHFSPAIYAVLEKLRTDLAWETHQAMELRIPKFRPDPV